MKIIGFLRGIKALILDIDDTVYAKNKGYKAQGCRGEIAGVANILGLTFEFAKLQITQTRQAIAGRYACNQATMTETVYSLGVTPAQWSELRQKVWQPEDWFKADERVSSLIAGLTSRFTIAFGTNSPLEVGRKIVRLVGITAEVVPDNRIFGPENLGVSKPDPNFYRGIARAIGIPACQCVSIGDREFSDGPPAIEAGFAGAIIVPGGRDELLEIVDSLN